MRALAGVVSFVAVMGSHYWFDANPRVLFVRLLIVAVPLLVVKHLLDRETSKPREPSAASLAREGERDDA